MLVSELKPYGFPDILIESWERHIGPELLPLQEEAVRDCDLLGQGNLIISAPTSSGKTFCGEIAMARALTSGQKAVCLVPLKALAEERYLDFEQKYARLGLRVIISTSDRREHDLAFQRGKFDLAVVIYEKFSQILTRNLDILSFIDLILIDELQMIADPNRGAALELLLLKIKKADYNSRLIGLSAVLFYADELAKWLNARLLKAGYRPVDLWQGVLWKGRFHYRKYNNGKIGQEAVLRDSSLSIDEQLIQAVKKFVDEGEKVLIFLKSKASCQYYAEQLSDHLRLERPLVKQAPASETIESLSDTDSTGLSEKLD
jgi:helicase